MPNRFLRYTLHTKSWNLKQILFHVIQKNLLPFPVTHPWNSCNGHSWYIICIQYYIPQQRKTKVGIRSPSHPHHAPTNHQSPWPRTSHVVLHHPKPGSTHSDLWCLEESKREGNFSATRQKRKKKHTPGWWWFQPIWQVFVQNWIISPSRLGVKIF